MRRLSALLAFLVAGCGLSTALWAQPAGAEYTTAQQWLRNHDAGGVAHRESVAYVAGVIDTLTGAGIISCTAPGSYLAMAERVADFVRRQPRTREHMGTVVGAALLSLGCVQGDRK